MRTHVLSSRTKSPGIQRVASLIHYNDQEQECGNNGHKQYLRTQSPEGDAEGRIHSNTSSKSDDEEDEVSSHDKDDQGEADEMLRQMLESKQAGNSALVDMDSVDNTGITDDQIARFSGGGKYRRTSRTQVHGQEDKNEVADELEYSGLPMGDSSLEMGPSGLEMRNTLDPAGTTNNNVSIQDASSIMEKLPRQTVTYKANHFLQEIQDDPNRLILKDIKNYKQDMYISLKYNKLYNKLSKILTNFWVRTKQCGCVMSECLKKVISSPLQKLFQQIKGLDDELDVLSDDPLYILFTLINNDYDNIMDVNKDQIFSKLSAYETIVDNFEQTMNQIHAQNPTIVRLQNQKQDKLSRRFTTFSNLGVQGQAEQDRFNECQIIINRERHLNDNSVKQYLVKDYEMTIQFNRYMQANSGPDPAQEAGLDAADPGGSLQDLNGRKHLGPPKLQKIFSEQIGKEQRQYSVKLQRPQSLVELNDDDSESSSEKDEEQRGGDVFLNESDYQRMLAEQTYCLKLMNVIRTDAKVSKLEEEAPKFYKHITDYLDVIQKSLEVYQWKPDYNQYSCDNLSQLKTVVTRKDEIWQSFVKYKNVDWNRWNQYERITLIQEQITTLVEFFTIGSDYMANPKVPQKDIAIWTAFLEPFKWDNTDIEKEKLGYSLKLLTDCFGARKFWTELRQSHHILRKKYRLQQFQQSQISDIEDQVNDVERHIQRRYRDLLVEEMPYNLCDSEIWAKDSIISYTQGKELRDYQSSLQQNASLLVRWASQVYGEWATWLKKLLPDCKCDYKKSTGRIVYKIEEMVSKKIIENKSEGWKNITDMLRASHYCVKGTEVNQAMDKLAQDDRVKILRIKERFGAPEYLNDVQINFNYRGQMICELQIKLGTGKVPILKYSNTFVYEIERVCDSRDRYKLFDAYNAALIYPTNHAQTIDSNLSKRQKRIQQIKDQNVELDREELTKAIQDINQIVSFDFGLDNSNNKKMFKQFQNKLKSLGAQTKIWKFFRQDKLFQKKVRQDVRGNLQKGSWTPYMYCLFQNLLYGQGYLDEEAFCWDILNNILKIGSDVITLRDKTNPLKSTFNLINGLEKFWVKFAQNESEKERIILSAIKNIYTIWDSEVIDAFKKFLFINRGIESTQFFDDYLVEAQDEEFKIETINEIMHRESFPYPRQTQEICKQMREACRLNYAKLLVQRFANYRIDNKFRKLSKLNISGLGFDSEYDYYGQVSQVGKNTVPDGIGLAVELRYGFILEGSFNKGKLGYLSQYIKSETKWVFTFSLPDLEGKKYFSRKSFELSFEFDPEDNGISITKQKRLKAYGHDQQIYKSYQSYVDRSKFDIRQYILNKCEIEVDDY